MQLDGAVLELVQGDITEQDTDAIVNAANSGLRGGGGVDGAIHRAAGPAIMQQTRENYPEGCPTGDARITGAGNLSAKHVIHAVGPVYRGGKSREPELLASAYRRSLEVAAQNGCRSVAFPSLSTGAYGYPVQQAASAALRSVADFLQEHKGAIDLVRFVLFDQHTLDVYKEAAKELK